MLQIQDLEFRYSSSERNSLHVPRLSIEPRDITLICGLTGSGKTTLLRCINGLIPHYYGGVMGGHVLVDGIDTRLHSPDELSTVVGTLFQEPENQFLMLTVREEIAFGMRNAGFDETDTECRIEEIASVLGISHLLSRNIFELSSGEKQKVALASVISCGPHYVLLDEPTSQLDAPSAYSVVKLLKNLSKDMGVIVTEHRIERLKDACSRFIAMEEGSISLDADYSSLQEWYLNRGIELDGHPLSIKGEPGEEMLSVEGLSVNFGERHVLNDVSLHLREGEIAMLVGYNGSGKTTLLKSIMNFIDKEGKVSFRGVDISGEEPQYIAKKIAYLSHSPLNYLFQPSLREELHFTLKSLGSDGDSYMQDALTLLETLGLSDKIDMFPREFSCGEKELAAVASVMAGRRECLLLDEPTRGMDYLRKKNFMLKLRALSSSGVGVLMATHDYNLVKDYADTVYLLRNGRCTELSPEQLGREEV